MDSLIVENEKQLSPVVVIMTAVLLVAFAIGFASSAVGLLV